MYLIVAEIEIAEAKRDALLDGLRAVVPKVVAIPGCLGIELLVDVPFDEVGIEPARPNVVTVIQRWEDLKAFSRNRSDPLVLSFINRFAGQIRFKSSRIFQEL